VLLLKAAPRLRCLNICNSVCCSHLTPSASVAGSWPPCPKALCYASSNQPSPASLGAVQKQWKVVALDWATASVFATGPSQTDNRHLRINAWPARPGLVEKQTRLLIHAAASLDGAELGDKVANGSAAIQGLPAAEYLLFNVLPEQLTGQEPGAGGGQIVAAGQIAETGQKTGAGTSAASFTDSCLALSAITAYMAQTATTLQLEWQQWPVLQSAMAALATATGIPDESKPVPEAYRQLQDKLLNGGSQPRAPPDAIQSGQSV
jgi:predicted lipoprotein